MKHTRTRAFAQSSCPVIPYLTDVLKHQNNSRTQYLQTRPFFRGQRFAFRQLFFPARLASLRSLSLEKEDGAVAEVEVDKVLRLCRHQGCVR